MRHIVSSGAVLLLVVSAAAAEPTTDVSGEVRIRDELLYEVFSPADPLGEEDFEFAHMRARLRVDAMLNAQVGAVIQLQDVRILGEAGLTVADTEGVDLKRGYILLRDLGGAPIELELGRFVMAYGDQRVIGHLEWVDQGRTYDGVHVSVAPEGWFVDVFGVRVREALVPDDDQQLFGVYAGTTAVIPDTALELYALGLRDEAALASAYATVGTRVAFAAANADATVEAALQAGELLEQDLLAFAAAVKAGYTIPAAANLRIGGELAYASGDDDPLDEDSGQFQTLFPTNHLHYGYADLAAWTNLLALRTSLRLEPAPAWRVSLDYHHLRLADLAGGWVNASGAPIRPGDPGASSTLGNEIDLVAWWQPLEGLTLEAGLAYFAAGGFVADTGGGGDAVFGYAQAGVQF